jgi:hypothetical protein
MEVQAVRRGISALLVWMLAVTPAFAQSAAGGGSDEPRSNVVGSVKREDGTPIAGAGVELLDREGAVFARSETGADGSYSMPCIPHGGYQIRLDTPEYQGETRMMPVRGPGVQVDWIFGADAKRPLALATPGGGACAADGTTIADATPKPSATPEGESWWWRNRYWIGGGLVVTGVGVGVGVGAGSGGGGSSGSGSASSSE